MYRMRKIIVSITSIVVILCASISILATAQSADRVVYNGQEKMLFSLPLEDYFTDEDSRPNFMIEPFMISSGNWRGYIATWQIDAGKLYLSKIDSWLCSGDTKRSCKKVRLADLFPGKVQNGRVLADWFTGELRVPDGKEIQYVHSGFASTYERDIVFTAKLGVLQGPFIVDNTTKELPSELEAMKKELDRLEAIKEKDKAVKSPAIPKREPRRKLSIIPGLSPFKHGAVRTDIEELVGDGDEGSRFEDVYFVEYPKVGVQVSYSRSRNTVHVIFLYNRGLQDAPTVVTDKGITWNSTEEDVLSAYGKPVKDYSDDSKSWRRLEYPGIDFKFDRGRLGRIGILGPDGN